MVADTRQVLHAASTNQHDRVFLKVVTNTGNVRSNLDAVRQSHTRHFPQSRIGLFRGGRVDTKAHTALLWTALERRALRLRLYERSPFTNELIDCRHKRISFYKPATNQNAYFTVPERSRRIIEIRTTYVKKVLFFHSLFSVALPVETIGCCPTATG